MLGRINLIKTTSMKLISFAKVAAAAILGTMLISGCEKPDNGPVSEAPRTNYFVYDGYSFEINSAVQYDKGDNSVEVWLSPISGLTTSKAIKDGGDYVVFNTHKSFLFLGDRDRFNSQASKDSYICFGEQKYAYGDQGTAYIEATMTSDSLKVNFLAEALHTKNSPVPVAMLSGSYAGLYTVENEKRYDNDWGFDREHAAIAKAIVTTREDGGNSSIALFGTDGREGIRIELPHSSIGKEYLLTSSSTLDEIKLYTSKNRFILKGAAGTIKTNVNGNTVTVSISLLKDGRHLRAEYSGAYEADTVKENRFIFNYEGTSNYIGKHEIVNLLIVDNGVKLKLYFSDNEKLNNTSEITKDHMPILTIPSEIVNGGRKAFSELEGWVFEYDVMQAWPYQDEYRPHAAATDWIEIKLEGNVYEVEFVLTSLAEGMPESKIDVYYIGEAR